MSGRSEYVELRARSAFSFLEGASAPEDLVESAAALGYDAIALGDRDGLYGAPRFYQAATDAGVKAIVGAELLLDDTSLGLAAASATPARLYVLVPDRERYRNLCHMITTSKLRPLGLDAGGSRTLRRGDDLHRRRRNQSARAPADPWCRPARAVQSAGCDLRRGQSL